MPTYQYACTECSHAFDQVQSFSDDSLTVCPRCEGRLRKVFNAVGVVFKGSGFYRTDSRVGAGGEKSSDTGSEAGTGSEKAPAKGSEKSPDKNRENPEKGPAKGSPKQTSPAGSAPRTGNGSAGTTSANTSSSPAA